MRIYNAKHCKDQKQKDTRNKHTDGRMNRINKKEESCPIRDSTSTTAVVQVRQVCHNSTLKNASLIPIDEEHRWGNMMMMQYIKAVRVETQISTKSK